MLKINQITFILFSLCLLQSAFAVSAKLPDADIGVEIRSVRTGKVLFQKNAKKFFTPASTMKLFTLATALQELKPSYRYETQVFYHKGDLYLKGSGDPSFSVHELDDLAGRIKQILKKSIRHIIVDNTVFDQDYYGEGWLAEDFNHGYSAPVSGINVNFNRIVVGFLPGRKVILDPYTRYAKLKYLKGHRFSLKGPGISIIGSIPSLKSPIYRTYAIKDPDQWAGFLFKESLNRMGVRVKGKIISGKIPEDLKPLTSSYSGYLSELVINYMKYSNNLGTEAILKTLGNGNSKDGIKLVKQFVGPYQIFDGSGLSRLNSISPHQMTQFLIKVSKDFLISPEFSAALPIAGEDGTLTNGFSKEPFRGNMRAKTGAMSDIQSWAGYYKKPDGEIVAFSIFANELYGSSKKLREWFQSLLIKL